MDWDEAKFKSREFKAHLRNIGLAVLASHFGKKDEHDLQLRTTRTTRSGNEFSFKPKTLEVGIISGNAFFLGFKSDVSDTHGVDPVTKVKMPSSFWFRFGDQKRGNHFQFRFPIPRGQGNPLLLLEGQLKLRDVIKGAIWMHAIPQVYTGSLEGRLDVTLTFTVSRPPRIAIRLAQVIFLGGDQKPVFERDATEADLIAPHFCEAECGSIASLGDLNAVIKPHLWSTYRVTFNISYRQYKLLWMCMVRLRRLRLKPKFSQPHIIPWRDETLDHLIPNLDNVPFYTRYLIEALICRNKITIPEAGILQRGMVGYAGEEQRNLLLERLFWMHRKRDIMSDMARAEKSMGEARQIPSYCVKTLRCQVTPLRLIFFPMEVEMSSSILRNYSHVLDRLIRVEFVGEQGKLKVDRITLSIDTQLQQRYGQFARIERVLKNGISVAGRTYTFLASSESQARERSCWMIAEDRDMQPPFTRETVLKWMGDVHQEKNIAKHAARLGLHFSTTRISNIPMTIKQERDPFDDPNEKDATRRFTDGVGKCSVKVVLAAAKSVKHDIRRWGFPSAIQIRIGGIKGMLCVSSDMKDYEVVVRDSMVKFKSDHVQLNVLTCAKFHPVHLNRQAIILLEYLGVPAMNLRLMFEQYKDDIDDLNGSSEDIAGAASSMFPLFPALKAGFQADPMVTNALQLIRCRLLSDLKWKAWIPVSDGALLKGVADETGTLKDDEIFCQINDGRGGNVVIEKHCTIYRNPCLHPGDVRRVKAVNIRHLSHLVNVVVFPVTGRQSLPSKLSGGDLDGDDYSVLWEPLLLVPQNEEPMDYTHPVAEIVEGEVQVEDVRKFFLDYIKNNLLGRICDCHMALADLYDPGDDRCLELAELASLAVDYHKTGIRVGIEALKGLQPEKGDWPDFMGREENGEPPRESKKVLGYMFRSIEELSFEEISSGMTYSDPQVNLVSTPETYLNKAAAMKAEYDFDLERLMSRHSIGTEAEFVTGYPLRADHHERNFKTREDKLRDSFELIRDEYVKLGDDFVAQNPSPEDHPSSLRDSQLWAAACYKVTFHAPAEDGVAAVSDASESDTESDSGSQPEGGDIPERRFMSFPWLFWRDLVALKGQDRTST